MNWISMKDKKPETGTHCLVVAGGVVQFMALAWDGKQFVWSDGFDYGDSSFDPFPSELASHWMPLPDPPDGPTKLYQRDTDDWTPPPE